MPTTNRGNSLAEDAYAIPFSEYDLDNGMHIILSASRSVPLVVTNLWYHVGAKDDPPARTGFAHLFEHMMFQGSMHVPKAGHFKYIQQAGGSLNATTSADRTNYFETLPASHLEMALWLESDRMLALDVTKENFENQRDVVKEERRQRYDNRPYGTVWENVVSRLWPAGTYHTTTIGSMEHLDQASIEDCLAFHHEFYKPNNCSLAIVGDFDEPQARRLVDRYFAPIPKGDPVRRGPYKISPVTEPVRFTMDDSIKLSEVDIAFQGPAAYERDMFVLELLGLALDSSRSSRLYQELVYRREIAQSVDSMTAWFEKSVPIMFQARVQPGHSTAEVEDAIWGEVDKLRANPIGEAELTKLQNRAEMQCLMPSTQLGPRADRLQRTRCYTGDTGMANREIGMFRSVTAEEIHQAANQYLDRQKSIVCHVIPRAK